MITQAASYPSERHKTSVFAIKYLTWIMDSGASVDIGPESVSVLSAVVLMEDKFNYRRGVGFFNEQLMLRCGFRNVKTLDVARSKAVNAGLLFYQPSAKRQPGIYWVLPDSIPDSSGIPSKNYQENGRETGGNGEGNGEPPSLTLRPIPNPKEESARAAVSFPVELLEWCEWWNRLHAQGLVAAAVKDPASKALQAAWLKAMQCEELQQLLSDRNAIERAIRSAAFIRDKTWFNLKSLFGGRTKSDQELYLASLLAGSYSDSKKSAVANLGAGAKFDPSKDYANVRF